MWSCSKNVSSHLPSWLRRRRLNHNDNLTKYLRYNFYHHDSISGKQKIFGHVNQSTPRLSVQLQQELADADQNRSQHAKLFRAITSIREHGHRNAKINPLNKNEPEKVPELNFDRYGLNDLTEKFKPTGLLYGENYASQNEVETGEGLQFLLDTYSGTTAYEFMYIENEAEREWLAQEIEQRATQKIPDKEKVEIALEMTKSQNFDNFLANKFPTLKRYGGEGCEAVMAFYTELFRSCARQNVDHLVIGMAHRGRLNFLTGLLKFPPVQIFQKIKGMSEFPPEALASGDVLSHLFTSIDLDLDGKNLHVSLLPNPSHLETVNPMAAGKARSKQLTLKEYDYAPSDSATSSNVSSRILCLQIHGDAALAGQGINQETLGFANVPHFRVGGSVHLVINNQLGFTTPQQLGRSSRYTSDVGKMVGTPVIHVNGDCPEEVAKAAKLAIDYRQKFGKDIFVDLICFRRWGHNELDDPTFTNPEPYKIIHNRKSVPDLYSEQLKEQNLLSEHQLRASIEAHNKILNENLNQVDSSPPPKSYLQRQWAQFIQAGKVTTTWDTGTDIDLLKYVGAKSVEFPNDFTIHPHLQKMHVTNRLTKITAGTNIDWATAEAMAFGSLLYQDFGVRLSGEDVGRGTFSHRHAMLVDQTNGEIFIPLNYLSPQQQHFMEVCNSTLSEEAVLAFEYGFSIDNPNNLVIWEAQFGDFFNGAQIPIDTLIASGETKWMLQSGLVMLLPHGMDGAGPEHSSCRIERFLQMTDSSENYDTDGDHNNLQVVNPTTPAQYFHLLRRQMLRNFRKPMVIIAPKILLRLGAATSSLADMGPTTSFTPIIGDQDAALNSKQITKLVFVSGKHFYAVKQKRDELNAKHVGIIRLESLCPFPVQAIEEELAKYPNATKLVWSQEEHRNQGAWSFIKPRFENLLGRQISYIGRGTLAAPAVGISRVHHRETETILNSTFLDK